MAFFTSISFSSWVAVFLFAAMPESAKGQEPTADTPGETVEKTLEGLRFEFEVHEADILGPITDLQDRYREQLKALRGRTTEAGDLDRVLAVEAELNGFQKGETTEGGNEFPELRRLQEIYRKALAERATQVKPVLAAEIERHRKKLLALQESLTRKSELERALEVRAAVEALDKGTADSLSGTAEVAKPVGSTLVGKTLHFPHSSNSEFTARLVFKEDGKVNWIGLGNAKVEWFYKQEDDPLFYRAWMPGKESFAITATVAPDGRKAAVKYVNGTIVEAEIRRSDRDEAKAP